MTEFSGLTPDTYRFFWELALRNDPAFFEANRARYQESVKKPLLQLAALLAPTALALDPAFNVRPGAVVSRIRRDTRYAKDLAPYRDHAWLGFKHPQAYNSESFMLYAEFERESYGYGMGMYAPNAQQFQPLRARMLARPETFLSIVSEPEFSKRFEVRGESYKRPRFTEGDPRLLPWLNRRSLSFCYSSPELKRTMRPEIAEEICAGFLLLKPVYRFLMGLD